MYRGFESRPHRNAQRAPQVRGFCILGHASSLLESTEQNAKRSATTGARLFEHCRPPHSGSMKSIPPSPQSSKGHRESGGFCISGLRGCLHPAERTEIQKRDIVASFWRLQDAPFRERRSQSRPHRSLQKAIATSDGFFISRRSVCLHTGERNGNEKADEGRPFACCRIHLSGSNFAYASSDDDAGGNPAPAEM